MSWNGLTFLWQPRHKLQHQFVIGSIMLTPMRSSRIHRILHKLRTSISPRNYSYSRVPRQRFLYEIAANRNSLPLSLVSSACDLRNEMDQPISHEQIKYIDA